MKIRLMKVFIFRSSSLKFYSIICLFIFRKLVFILKIALCTSLVFVRTLIALFDFGI